MQREACRLDSRGFKDNCESFMKFHVGLTASSAVSGVVGSLWESGVSWGCLGCLGLSWGRLGAVLMQF